MKRFKGEKGKWYIPHMTDPNAKCDCNFILSDTIMGSVGGLFAIGYVDYARNEQEAYYETPTIEEATANAHLIATAPELLKALIEIVEANKNSSIISATSIAISKSEQIINKALGHD